MSTAVHTIKELEHKLAEIDNKDNIGLENKTLEQKKLILDFLFHILTQAHGDCFRSLELALNKLVPLCNGTDISLLEQAMLQNYEETSTDELNSIAIQIRNSYLNNEQKIILSVYILFTYYRHFMEYNKLDIPFKKVRELIDKESEYVCLGHLCTLYYISSTKAYTADEIDSFLAEAYTTTENYQRLESIDKNSAGVLHAFADLFATYCERYEDNKDIYDTIFSNHNEHAKSTLSTAMYLSNYPKYHCTYGRILALNHEYDKAIAEIQEAIKLESSSKKDADHMLKIIEYKSHLVSVKAKNEFHKLNEQQKTLQNNIDKHESSFQQLEEQTKDVSKHNLEIISFFSGIISFTIGSFSLASAFTAGQAAGLILVLSGALLIAFDGFSILLHINKKNVLKYIILFILGLLCILGGLQLVQIFQPIIQTGLIL